jgi:hypothetical protein
MRQYLKRVIEVSGAAREAEARVFAGSGTKRRSLSYSCVLMESPTNLQL